MKKLRKALRKALVVLSVLLSANAFGQLQMESAKEYESVYDYTVLGITHGEIRDMLDDKGFYYLGRTDNQFEKKMCTIYLGKTKEEVFASLRDLENLRKNCPEDGVKVKGIGGKTTRIYPYIKGQLKMETEHVAGTAYYYVNYKKAIQKLEEYFATK